MMRSIVLVVIAMGLYACSVTSPTGSGSPYAETGAICDNPGLESQLVSIRDRSRATSGALGVIAGGGGGAAGASNAQNDVERVYQLRDRLNRFDAEVDVQYRSITSSCKAYARCMEMRGYNEGSCRQSRMRWDAAEQRFASLSVVLREIDAEVEKIRLQTRGGRGRRGPQLPNRCAQQQGGVFTNCADQRGGRQ